MRDARQIGEMLRHHPWSREAVDLGYEPVFTRMGIDHEKRAAMLVEDMRTVGCDWPVRSTPIGDHVVLSHYEIPGTHFGVDTDEDAQEALKAHGTGLNWGSIVRLSKACEIGHRYFPSDWPRRFREQLLNTKDHLPFIEEMLWLNLWHGVSGIEYEAQPFFDAGHTKHVDWSFRSCDYPINLEIKYRPRDWMRKVDGEAFNVAMPSYYYDVPPKFPEHRSGELNLVGVSTPAPMDRSLRQRTEILLREHETIDGVIIWSQSSESTSPFEIHSLKCKDLIGTLFTGGDFEDASHIGVVRHLWRKRDERRAYRAHEVPALLQELSKRVSEATHPPPQEPDAKE
jgi:hypothetical protein